jgi:hypothetical protein
VVASGAGGGTATQRRPGLRTEGGYTLTMRAGGEGEIGAVFNGHESYNEEDRYHPHPPHLETHCLQYQDGCPWRGSKAYAMQWGQGSVYADSAESGDDEEYCGIFDDEDGTDFRRKTLNSQRKEVSYAESINVMSKGCPEQRLTPAVVCAEKCMTAYLKGGIYMASTVANTRSDGDRSGEFLTCILVLQVRLYFYMYISYM